VLRQIALVLGLQVDAPLHGIVKLLTALFQQVHRFRVAHPAEVGGGHMLQTLPQALIHELVEEVHLLRALLHHIADDILDHVLGGVHIAVQIGEGHLRLHHPELSGVTLGVGILRTEGRTKGIDIAEGHGEVLGVQLTGHRQAGLLAEEVLTVIHLTVLRLGDVVQVQRGHLEHLAGALAVAGGDDGGLCVDKAAILEELVDGVGRRAPHPEGGGEQVRPGTQVLDSPQELYAVALFLQGIVRSGDALHGDLGGLQLQWLLGIRCQGHNAGDDQSRAYVLGGDVLIVREGLCLHHHLKIAEAGAVIQLDEAEALQIPDGADPAAHGNGLTGERLAVCKNFCDFCVTHSLIRPLCCWYNYKHNTPIFRSLQEGTAILPAESGILRRKHKFLLNFGHSSDIMNNVNAGVMELVDVTDSKASKSGSMKSDKNLDFSRLPSYNKIWLL